MKNTLSSVSDLPGRVIAYIGGGGVSLASNIVTESNTNVVALTPDIISTGHLISLGGLLVVAGRLAFDIWKEVDRRRNKGNVDDE